MLPEEFRIALTVFLDNPCNSGAITFSNKQVFCVAARDGDHVFVWQSAIDRVGDIAVQVSAQAAAKDSDLGYQTAANLLWLLRRIGVLEDAT